MTFKNEEAIKSVCSLLIGSAESVIRMTNVLNEESELTQIRCGEFRFDELERIQRLVLDLTELIAEDKPKDNLAANGDGSGSAFSQGELTSDLGDKTGDEDVFPDDENDENKEEN